MSVEVTVTPNGEELAADNAREDSALETAETIVETAQKLADMANQGDDAGKALLAEMLSEIRAARAEMNAQHAETIARLDAIQNAQIVEELIEEMDEALEPETPPAETVHEETPPADTGSEVIEKESVVIEPAVERGNEKPARVWL